MLFITDSEFERTVSRLRNRRLAQQLYEQGAVTRVHIEYKNERYEIIGNVFTNNTLYTPRVFVNKFSKIIQTDCDCEFYDAYTACGHAGALILAVQNLSPDTFPFDYEADVKAAAKRRAQERLSYQERIRQEWENQRIAALESVSETLTQGIKDRMQQEFEADHTPVHLNLYFQYNYFPQLRVKIGRDKYYFIKDLNKFIRDVSSKSYHSYGKNFSWVHNYDDFDDESKKIFDYLRDNMAKNDYSSYYSNSQSLNLSGATIDGFYELLQELPPKYIKDIKVEEKEYKPVIKTTRNDRDVIYRIERDDEKTIYSGSSNLYYFDHEHGVHSLNVILGDKQGIFMTLLNAFDDNSNKIYVPLHKEKDFNRYLIAPIKDFINFEDDADLNQEDRIEIYGDINDEEEAYFNILGIYNEEKINLIEKPDTPHSAQADLVMDYLERYSTNHDDTFYYFDTNVDDTIEFLDQGVPFLNNYADIYVSDALKKIGTKNRMKVNVGITVSHDLLSIDVDSIGIPKDELAAVMASFKKKKKYHKLKSGELLHIESDELSELQDMMDRYHLVPKDMQDGHIDMDLNRAYALDMSADNMKYVTVERSEAFKDVINRLDDYKSHKYEIDQHFGSILRDYQKEGYQWLSTMSDLHFGGILADDMGLGKTLQVIALLENAKKHFSVVVCPSSLVLNWNDEFGKFTSTLRNVCVMGNAKQREEIIKNASNYDILITSYDYIRRDIEHYKDLHFDYIILDEAQYIKNQQTKNAQSVKQLNGTHKFALTGTPIENSLAELWSIFDFLNKGYLFTYNYFRKTYEAPIVKDQDEKKQAELKKLISPFVLRRTKKQVLTELPEKVENTMTIDFDEDEKKVYFAHLAAANKELQTLDGNTDRIQILAMLTKLRQICCEPRMLFDTVTRHSSKMEACLDLIENYHENGKKCIVFSSFAQVLDLLARELNERGIKYHILTGSTNKIKRKQRVDAFQNDDSTVFLISLKAGGTGLNLTAAEGVIHFDPWWNMSAQSQATDRAHRIGQKNTVFVYKLIMKDSIEEKIQKIQEEKKNLADIFVEDNEGIITTMTGSEIMSLFED